MNQPVLMPDLGLQEMLVSQWLVQRGDEVCEGDRLLEIVAPGVSVDLPAPVSGRLISTLVAEDDTLDIGQLLGVIDVPAVVAEHDSELID